jgi:elongation factor 1-gamma
MVVGTLHTFENNFRAQKILLAAKFSGKEVKLSEAFELGKTNQSSDFLSKFPLGKVPALDLPTWVQDKEEGQPSAGLTESNAIAYYVANETLRGGNEDIDKARVLQWMFFSDNELIPTVFNYLFPVLGLLPDKNTCSQSKVQVTKILALLNDYLKDRVYLVGESVTLADLSVATSLMPLLEHGLEEVDRQPFVHLLRWFETVIRKKASEAVIGKFEFCTKIGIQGLGSACVR